ncbi:c-type cytochrome domain-containing protein [Algoriphagus sp.]|uniref:c-type cytochrome domain-containing protein n=1 Tax=Algoriphagus sp. TaxID=1872435 RepID=UPI00391C7459
MLKFLGPLLGRMHPVLVHLPIGILIFGIVLCFFPQREKNTFLPAIRLAFLLGGIAALGAGISGFLQYQFEGFSWEDVRIHLIGGVLTALGSFGLFFHFKKRDAITPKSKAFALGLGLILMITGHLGGNLTHGESYFTEVLPPELQSFFGIEIQPEKGPQLTEESWGEAVFYSEVIQPILNQNCKSCHNPRNKKGELDLTTLKGLMTGGEDGVILTAGDAQHSELFSRLILAKEDEKHMPPSEKRQPSKEEIALIETWIKSGGKANQTLAEAGISRKLIEPFIQKNEVSFYPTTQISAISADSLAQLKDYGFFAELIESGSGLLKITCTNFPGFQDSDWEKLAHVKNRIAYLDLSGTQVSDAILDSLTGFSNLTVLKLNATGITGNSLKKISQSPNLKLLYLNKTGVNLAQIQQLTSSQSLQKVFIFDTPASAEFLDSGKLSLPFLLETGNYQLPKLPTDTIVY